MGILVDAGNLVCEFILFYLLYSIIIAIYLLNV